MFCRPFQPFRLLAPGASRTESLLKETSNTNPGMIRLIQGFPDAVVI
jgi:hypothetical protein